jgi:hypothetical protein
VKEQEAQSNSVAERRGWEQRRARLAVDSESELDSARQVDEPARIMAKSGVWITRRAEGTHTRKEWPQKLVGWLEIECQSTWARETREPHAVEEPEFMSGAQGNEEPGCVAVRASVVAQASRKDGGTPSAPARRRVMTAGAKGRRKVEAR